MRTGKLQSAAGYEHALIPALPWAPGRIYYSTAAINGFSTQNLPSGRTIYQPFYVPPGGVLPDRIGCRVSTAYASGSVRLGLYADAGGVPGALLGETGDQAITAIANIFTAITTPQPGWVWAAFNHNGSGGGAFQTFAYATSPLRASIGANGLVSNATPYVDETVIGSGFPASAGTLLVSNDHIPVVALWRA